MTLADFPAVAALPIHEKQVLIEFLRDAIAMEEGPGPLTDEQLAELNCRRAAYEADPSSAVSWDEVKARCLAWKAAKDA